MKKIVCALIALMLTLPMAALASDLEITQEAFYVTPYSNYFAGEIFCEITNTTDRIIEITGGTYELFGQDGASIDSGSIYGITPDTIRPGEHAYIYLTKSVKDATSADYIKSYSVNVVGKTAAEKEPEYPLSDVHMEEIEGRTRRMKLVATVTNDTDEPIGDITVVFAVYDAEGALLYAGVTSSLGLSLTPGSSGIMDTELDRDILTALADQGKEPATVVAVAKGLW